MIKELWDWIKTFAIAIVIVILVRLFLLDNYIVHGQSMEPNFYHSDRLVINKILYDIRAPKRGEVIVLHAPGGEDYIKRVIALPGETIKIQGDHVYINGERLEESYIEEEVRKAMERGTSYNHDEYPRSDETITVPEGAVFVLGDNRPNSKDSRSIGFILIKDIVGRAEFIYWPLKDFKWLRY